MEFFLLRALGGIFPVKSVKNFRSHMMPGHDFGQSGTAAINEYLEPNASRLLSSEDDALG
jgi:hypothetical protein